jgi:hypothetical protein
MLLMILMALLLAACGGNGDEDAQPVGQTDDQAVEATIEPTATALAEEEEEESTPVAAMASPGVGAAGATPDAFASPVSPAAGGFASPVAAASPVGMASPVAASPEAIAAMAGATPMTMASPVASTPAASNVVVPPVSGDDATPASSPAATITLNGEIELSGNENQAYVLSNSGCVGLGSNADLQEGRQLVVRNESGMIIGVTTLEAAERTDVCAWAFSVNVAESEFYAVSIPMRMELVFTHDDIAETNGDVTIILP